MNNREIRFRESFRGYNRDDVKAYIEQLNLIFAKKEADLHAYIAELESKVSNVPAQTENTYSEQEWNDLSAKLEAAQNEIDRLSCESAANDEAEKSKLYDSMSAQVGNIIISANANADKIIADANEEAARIRSEADIYADSVRAEADKMRDDIVGGINEKVRDFAVECVTQYGTIIGETGVKLENIADNLKSRSDNLLVSLQNKTKEIEAKLILHNEK